MPNNLEHTHSVKLLRMVTKHFGRVSLIAGPALLFIILIGFYLFHEIRLNKRQSDLLKRIIWVKINQEKYLLTFGKKRSYPPSNEVNSRIYILEAMRQDPLALSLSTEFCALNDPKKADQEYNRLRQELIAPSNGYQFDYYSNPGDSNISPTYRLIFYPINPYGFFRTGNDCFYLDQTGIIRHSGSPTKIPDANSSPVE